MREDAEKNHPFAQAWIDYGISRTTTKRPVMCYSYGLTRYSNRQYILDWFEEKIHADSCNSPCDLEEDYKAVNYLSEIVWKAIEEILDLPKQCMHWFQQVARIVSGEQRHLKWVTPSGFIVKQDYRKLRESKLVTWITGEAIHVNFNETTEQLSPRSMSNGISPNVVHGLDAALLHLVVIAANKRCIYDFSMIHASYGTHSKNSEILAEVIREPAVDMFSPVLLRNWLDQIKKQHPDLEFPEPPKYGQADISLLKESPYFFS